MANQKTNTNLLVPERVRVNRFNMAHWVSKERKIQLLAKQIEDYILYFATDKQPDIDPKEAVSEIIRLALDLRRHFEKD